MANFNYQNNIGTIQQVSIIHGKTKEMAASIKVTGLKLIEAKKCCEHCKMVALQMETDIREKEIKKKRRTKEKPMSPSSVQ
jgi:hypothetical protein